MSSARRDTRPSAWLLLLLLACAGCAGPRRLTFPRAPDVRDERGMWYRLNGSDNPNFAVLNDPSGRLRTLAYDDNDDGVFDRTYDLDSRAADSVPHLIIMLDSIPYAKVAEQYAAGRLTWFDPPQKVIPPFPTMSGVIFTSIMHAPQLPGMINRYYERSSGRTRNLIVNRAFGAVNPWQERLHYRAEYWENGLSFLWPRHWFERELARAKRAFDEGTQPVTIVYIASTSAMLSRHGAAGLDEIMNGVEQLCCQILHERAGAVHISMLADHGHNLVPGTRISLEDTLKAAGFRPAGRLQHEDDVIIENDGMVNYIGMHTRRPEAVAKAVISRPELQLAMYRVGERVIVRSVQGAAAIEHHGGRFRYVPLDADVLDYGPVLERLAHDGRADAEGFIADRDWLTATIDHEWPDAPPRLWKAFDNLVANTPDVMLTLQDGYCTGLGFLELFISMASTHGGLNQVNSATFVMSTTGRAQTALRSEEILPAIAPSVLEQFNATADRTLSSEAHP